MIATGASSPEIGLSARPSLAIESDTNVGVGGSPSTGADLSREDSQRRLLPELVSDKKSSLHPTHSSTAPASAPAVHFKHRTPTFAAGTSRKLHSMATLKKAAA
jgi:hypothetical protein